MLDLDLECLSRFLRRVEDGYPSNPYHNAIHAADVVQSLHLLMTKGGVAKSAGGQMCLLCGYIGGVSLDCFCLLSWCLKLEHLDYKKCTLWKLFDFMSIVHRLPTGMEGIADSMIECVQYLITVMVTCLDWFSIHAFHWITYGQWLDLYLA